LLLAADAYGQAASHQYRVSGNNFWIGPYRYLVSAPDVRFVKDGVPAPYKMPIATLYVQNLMDRSLNDLVLNSSVGDLVAEIPQSMLVGSCRELRGLDDDRLPQAHRAGWCALQVDGEISEGTEIPRRSGTQATLTIGPLGVYVRRRMTASQVRIYAQGQYVDPRPCPARAAAVTRQASGAC
jgi:hypothetical protein